MGFCLGAYKDGLTAVVPPAGCRNVSATAAACAGLLQRFVRERSRLPAWDKRCNSGALHAAVQLPACCRSARELVVWVACSCREWQEASKCYRETTEYRRLYIYRLLATQSGSCERHIQPG